MDKTTSMTFPQGFYHRGSNSQSKGYPMNFYTSSAKQPFPVDFPQNFYHNAISNVLKGEKPCEKSKNRFSLSGLKHL